VRFLVDMGVGPRVVHWLIEYGHDAVHLRDQGLHRLADDAIFAKARAEDRIVLTWDLDFTEIVSTSQSKTSAIVFRLRNTRTDHLIFNRAPRRRPRERCRRTRRGSDRERRGHALPPAQVARRTLTAQPPQFRARRRTIPLTSLRTELAIGMMDHEPADAYPRGATWLQCNERG